MTESTAAQVAVNMVCLEHSYLSARGGLAAVAATPPKRQACSCCQSGPMSGKCN
jgi:hypothetical protein